MRNEHGQFAMSIGATSILDQPYLDDDDDSVMKMTPHRMIQMMTLT